MIADTKINASAAAHQFQPAPRAPQAGGSRLQPQALQPQVVGFCNLPAWPPPTPGSPTASVAGAVVLPRSSPGLPLSSPGAVMTQAVQPVRVVSGRHQDAAYAAGAVSPSLTAVGAISPQSGKPAGFPMTHQSSSRALAPPDDGRAVAVPAQFNCKVGAVAPSLAAPGCDGAVGATAPARVVAMSKPAPVAAKPQELRMRFFNYNMGNNSEFEVPGQPGLGLASLQGPGGRGRFEGVWADLADGQPVDLVFAAFVETHLTIQEWVEQYLDSNPPVLDEAVAQSALKESMQELEHAKIRGLMEKAAAKYNGNLKNLLLYSSKMFAEEEEALLFGRLVEKKVAGLAVPNPKKAFAGRSLRARGEGIRFCLIGAHFPVSHLAAALEEPESPLEAAKVILARTLRRVLRRAARRGILDTMTVLVVQGDLNSRTVLHRGRTMDVLLEVIRDERLQTAMRHGLAIPEGRWREVAEYGDASSLPVTYKFGDELGSEYFAQKFSHKKAGEPNGVASFTIGDIVSAGGGVSTPGQDPSEIYRRVLQRLPAGKLQELGLDFKESSFRPFRFPSAADRVIYWAPDSLGDRMSWTFPRGAGYEVNHFQSGSDHRPVYLEAVLRIAPAAEAGRSAAAARPVTAALPVELVQEITQDDAEDSDDEWTQSDLAAVGHAVQIWAGAASSAVRASAVWGNFRKARKSLQSGLTECVKK